MSLTKFDPPTIFACGVELAEATANYRPEEHAHIPAQPANHHTAESLEAVLRWHQARDAIEEASNRLKRALGAKGPLDADDLLRADGPPTWEEFRGQFKYAAHEPTVRRALWKLANAAVDLSGYSTVRVPDPLMRERGLRLLAQGLAQLWAGMTNPDREKVRSSLAKAHAALGWPPEPAGEPPSYAGPGGIAETDQYRVIDQAGGFATRSREYLGDQ